MNVNKAIQLAHEHFQTGNFQQAAHIYKKILKREPNNFDALHFLGVIYFQLGNNDLAIQYIKKALQFNPNIPEIYNNLGNIL